MAHGWEIASSDVGSNQESVELRILSLRVLGLEPDGRRPWVQRAVRALKGFEDFYGEGKI
jgi:hypothetical protein